MLAGSPFHFRGVEYEVRSAPSGRSSLDVDRDFAEIRASGFTVVSTATDAPALCEAAAGADLRLLISSGDHLWDSLRRGSRRERWRAVGECGRRLRRMVRDWRGVPPPLALVLPDPPPSVSAELRSARLVRNIANRLAACVAEEDPRVLVAWRATWPLAHGCPEDVDFLMLDARLARSHELRSVLTSCHRRVGDRPVVLGSASLATDVPGDGPLDAGWVVDTALERGVGGMLIHRWRSDAESRATRAGSTAGTFPVEPATASANHRTVRTLDRDWPSVSVVINAYNAEATLEQCLQHCLALDYPALEVIVVDDGSTDGTRAIAQSAPGVRLVDAARSGLPAARNVGYRAARGALVAYLDADAYPSPDWPWYIALGALGAGVAGAGGPNVPPRDDPASARVVAHSPGNPLPELRDEDSAAHVPGCNMAFWKQVLEDLHGFDAGLFGSEDLEFEFRLSEAGWTIGYHPAALVWHHRRPGLAPYLRQQRHWGRSHAWLERRYPEHFPRGYRLRRVFDRVRRRPGERATSRSLAIDYVSLPRRDAALVEAAHQWGMPAATALACCAPLGVANRRFLAGPALAVGYATALFAFDFATSGQGRRRPERSAAFRAQLATFRLLRPLAFRWGHLKGRREFRAVPPDSPPRPRDLSALAERPVGARQSSVATS